MCVGLVPNHLVMVPASYAGFTGCTASVALCAAPLIAGAALVCNDSSCVAAAAAAAAAPVLAGSAVAPVPAIKAPGACVPF